MFLTTYKLQSDENLVVSGNWFKSLKVFPKIISFHTTPNADIMALMWQQVHVRSAQEEGFLSLLIMSIEYLQIHFPSEQQSSGMGACCCWSARSALLLISFDSHFLCPKKKFSQVVGGRKM